MTYFIFLLIVLAGYHFVYESILAPSSRLALRIELLALRDRLGNLRMEHAGEFEDRHFQPLQDSINTLIVLLPRFGISTLVCVESEIKRNPELRRLAEARTLILDDCRFEDARQVRRASLEIASRALAINAGGWFVYVVPGMLVVATYLAAHFGVSRCIASILGRIKAVLSLPQSEIEKVQRLSPYMNSIA